MQTRFAKYGTESGRGDGQGDVEKKDHQSYRRPYMMGKARGKVSKSKGRDAKADSERSGRTMRNNGQRNIYQRLGHWPTTVKCGQYWWIANHKDAPT